MQARSSNVMSCSRSVADKEVQLPLSFLLLPDDPANQDIFVGNSYIHIHILYSLESFGPC